MRIARITTALLATAAGALLLTGCGGSPSPVESVTTSTSTTAPTTSVATTPSTIAPPTPDQAAEAARVAAEQEAARVAAESSAAAQSSADQAAAGQSAADQASAEAAPSSEAQAAAGDAELRACRALAGRGDAYYMRLIPSHAYDLEQAYEDSNSESAFNALTSWCEEYGVSLDILEPPAAQSTADEATQSPALGDLCTDATQHWMIAADGYPMVCRPSPTDPQLRWGHQ